MSPSLSLSQSKQCIALFAGFPTTMFIWCSHHFQLYVKTSMWDPKLPYAYVSFIKDKKWLLFDNHGLMIIILEFHFDDKLICNNTCICQFIFVLENVTKSQWVLVIMLFKASIKFQFYVDWINIGWKFEYLHFLLSVVNKITQ